MCSSDLRKEGYSTSYFEISITVKTFDGLNVDNVVTYKVIEDKQKDKHQAPTQYYLNLIIKNAKKYNFHPEYIKYLESIDYIVNGQNNNF